MRRFLLPCGCALLTLAGLVGCGGHEGGVVDVPLSENPYQISEQQQQAMNAGIVETAALTDEEIAAIEEEKQKALEEAEAQAESEE